VRRRLAIDDGGELGIAGAGGAGRPRLGRQPGLSDHAQQIVGVGGEKRTGGEQQ
jgi:hypothetical protein